MTTNHKASEKSGRAFRMTTAEAGFSIASLLYFQSKMPDQYLKLVFEKQLLKNLSDHVAGLNCQKLALDEYTSKRIERSKVCDTVRAENYGAENAECRLSWMLTYAAREICQEAPSQKNVYKDYFASVSSYLFTDNKKALSFKDAKPKTVVVEKPSFKLQSLNVFKSKSADEKLLDSLVNEVQDFLAIDPFVKAIATENSRPAMCFKKLQENIDMFVQSTGPILEKYWQVKGMIMPTIPQMASLLQKENAQQLKNELAA